jgi:Zn-dependent protease
MMTFLFVTVGWIFSVCLHEFSHALVAYLGGDTSVKEKGYLTFNPLKYTHPVYSLVMPILFLLLGGIGLPGGAVYIDDSKLRSKAWSALVSLAGPASNLVLVVVLAFAFRFVPKDLVQLRNALAFLIIVQASAVILNLLPIPPLDGYRAISAGLDPDLKKSLDRAGRWTLLALFMLLWYVPPANRFFWQGIYGLTSALGVSAEAAYDGLKAFHFWRK